MAVEEFLRMAEEAGKEGAHVAALSYYRDAAEATGYSERSGGVLLAAVQYAQRLKKERDRMAIARWGQDALQKITPKSNLAETINAEIAKLQAGDKNAAT